MDCTVITNISPRGDQGEDGWNVGAEEFDYCTHSGSHNYWHGATQDPLINVIPFGVVYMLDTARASISDDVFAGVEHRISGIVDSTYRAFETRSGDFGNCWVFVESSIIEEEQMEPEHITSGIFATYFRTKYRDGKTYYYVSGWQLGKSGFRQSSMDFDGSSRSETETIGWCDYISEAAYAGLSTVMKDAFDASDHRVAPYNAMVEIPLPDPGYFKLGLISNMVYDVHIEVPDRCAGVVCDPDCVGADMYSHVCIEGECVPDALIGPDSPDCDDGIHDDPNDDDPYAPPPDDTKDLLDTVGMSREQATAAIIIAAIIIILRRIL